MRFQQPSSVTSSKSISLDEFANGSTLRTVAPDEQPWERLDPEAPRRTGLNVRLNDWELEVVRYLAKKEGRSQLDIIRRALRPVLEAAVASEQPSSGTTPV